jgi:sulfur carrier protein
MEITVNQQTYSVSDGCSLQHMLDAVLQKQAQGIALAVNQEIISKNDWEHYRLKSGDTIVMIKATQGG